ncbi:MAG: hypothetical protein M1371_06360, partial [Actinobacteria bacterium]|nr:hypothetical protein [Actinomycetota bacterium]
MNSLEGHTPLSVLEHPKCEDAIISDLFKYSSPDRIDTRDRLVLRDLAKKLKEIAANPKNEEKINQWKKHNSL